MKEKSIKQWVALITIVLFLAVFIFPPQTGGELSFEPYSVLNLSRSLHQNHSHKKKELGFYFKNQSYFGFVSQDLESVKLYPRQSAVTVFSEGYIEYSQVQNEFQSLIWMNQDGEFQKSLHVSGYPYFDPGEKRLFLINTQSSGVKEIDHDGEVLWEFQYPSVLTSLQSASNTVALGWLNGRIIVLDNSGQIVYEYDEKPSRINVNYALAFSRKKKLLAAVNGLGPQNLMLFRKKAAEFQESLSIPLESEMRRKLLLEFTQDQKFLLIEQKKNLLLLSLTTKEIYKLPFTGRLISVAEAEAFNLLLCLSDGLNNSYELSLFSKPDLCLGASEMRLKPRSLFIIDDKLVCLFEDYLVSYLIKDKV